MQNIAQLRYSEIARAFRQAPWRVQTQLFATLAAAAVVVVALGGMYLATASRAATAGRDVQSLEAQTADLEISIHRYQALVAEAKSLNRLEGRARDLGYVPANPDQMEYIVVNGYPGAQQTGAPPTVDVPNYDETLGTWLVDALSAIVRPGR